MGLCKGLSGLSSPGKRSTRVTALSIRSCNWASCATLWYCVVDRVIVLAVAGLGWVTIEQTV